jgi:3-deoxy-manno-octulosonate cytidylyltransferase (CMP-KDO synthetase)
LKIAIAIPARLNSTRLNEKVVKKIYGKTMLEHVWQRANLINEKVDVFIISGDDSILEIAKTFGSKTFKSKIRHNSGTSRVHEFSKKHYYDHYLILQADEILINPTTIEKLILEVKKNKSFTNVITKLQKPEDLRNEDIVKCKLGASNQIIDLSRYYRLQNSHVNQFQYTFKICGLYSIPVELLHGIFTKPQTIIAKNESVEQMQIIELGEKIRALQVSRNDISVNTAKEWKIATELLKHDKFQRKILSKYT